MKKNRILIVEDEALVARDIHHQLLELGFEPVGHTGRGEEAIRLAGEMRPDLVLMDIFLAGKMDGIEAATAIRRQFKLPVVFLTAFAEEETLRRAKSAEPFGYIIKPFDERELRTVIEIALHKGGTERQLQESEARYRAATQFAPDAIVTADHNGDISGWNRSAERMFGYKEPEALRHNVTMLMPAWMREKYEAVLSRAREEDHVPGAETELVGLRKDGTEFPLEISLAHWDSAHGTCVTVILRDITARKQADDKVRTLSQAVEQSPVTIVITNAAGSIEYVNPKFTELTGYALEEARGKNPRLLKSGEMPPEVYRELWQALASGRVWRGEFLNRKKNGELFWEQATITALRDGTGKTTHYVAVKEDITERKQLQADLVRAHDEALAASKLKSQFLATVSHEIRTPINGILGMAEILMETPLDPEQAGMAQVIKTGADNLLVIINDILDFSKIQAGKFPIVSAHFDLRTLVTESLALLAPQALLKELVLRCDLESAPLGRHLGDASRIRQVLTNLAGNAIKFTERGEVTVAVQELTPHSGTTGIRVEVRDTGIGIPLEANPKLFQAFTQVDGSITRKFGGTGLGLAISRQLVELMGGKIGFESELGRGSTFWFELELARGPEAPSDALPVRTATGPALASLRVLVADDSPMNQIVAQTMLARMGHTAEVVSNGEQALTKLGQQAYSVVLMDCQMPVLDGYAATRRIRAGSIPGVDPLVPIIALTAYALPEDRQKCFDAGMDDYLSKPVRSAELHAALLRCGLVQGQNGRSAAVPNSEVTAGEKPRAQVVDLKLIEMMRGLPGRTGPSLLPELIAVFLREEPARLAELAALAAEKNTEEFSRRAHTFAGSCANLGGQHLRAAALALERAAHLGAWSEMPARFAAFHEARARFHAALAQHRVLPR